MGDRKFKKIKKKSKSNINNSGMTLVEVMVALLIMSIVLGAMGTVYLVSIKYVDTYTSKRQTKLMIDTTLDTLINGLTYATQIYISNTPAVPAEWEGKTCYYYKVDNYQEDGKCGTVSTENMEALFDPELYQNGFLHCTVDFDNHTSQNSQKNLLIQFEFCNQKGEQVYTRNRQIDVINMTYQNSNISGTKGENAGKDLYIFYRKDTEMTGTREDALWNVFLQLYDKYTKGNSDYYKNFILNTTIPCDANSNIKIGPVYSRHGAIMWQYRASNLTLEPEQNWGITAETKRDESLLIVDGEKLKNWGIQNLNGKQVSMEENTFYMLPYHFVNTTERLDMLFYVDDTSEFDKEQAGHIRQTQLIYNNEEKKWYYLKIGAGEKCTSLKAGNIEYSYFPIKEGVNIQYTFLDESGNSVTKETVIMSSVQIKLFFKTFGEPLS